MGPADYMQRIRDAARGTVSEMKAMILANQALNSGIEPLYRNIDSIIRDVTDVSTSLGRNASEDIERVTLAIIKQEQELLDELGIVQRADDAYKAYAATLGKAASGLTDMEKRAGFAVAVIEKLSEKAEAVGRPFSSAADSMNNAALASSRLSAEWENLSINAGDLIADDVGDAVSRTSQVVSALDRLISKYKEYVDLYSIETHRKTLENRNAATYAYLDSGTRYRVDPNVDRQQVPGFNLPADKGFSREAEAAPFRTPDIFGTDVKLISVETRLDLVALREVDETLDMLTKARSVQIATEIAKEDPEFRGLFDFNARPFSPQDAASRFSQDKDFADSKEQFFEGRALFEAFAEGTTHISETREELQLFVSSLDSIHPVLGSLSRTAINAGSSINILSNPATGLLGKLGAGAGLFGAAASVAIPAIKGVADWLDIGKSAADRMREAEEALARQREAHADTLRSHYSDVLEDIRFAELISDRQFSHVDVLTRAFQGIEGRQLQELTGLPSGAQELQELPINFIIQSLQSAYHKADTEFQPILRDLTRGIIRRQRTIADAEIAAREEQAEIVIEAIERQRQAVLQKYADAEEAQRAAALRTVATQFDFLEAELRARYSPQFQAAAGDDASTLALRERAFADIERLRSHEGRAGEQALQGVSQQFAGARDRTNALYDGMIQAVRDAIPDLSQPFVSAVAEQTQAFLARWDAGLVLEKDTSVGLSEDTLTKLQNGEALTTTNVADLLAYQLGIKDELENAKIFDLTDDQITKIHQSVRCGLRCFDNDR